MQFCGTGCVQLIMHTPAKLGVEPQHGLGPLISEFTHTWPVGQSEATLHAGEDGLQHWYTQRLLPAVVLTQMHCFLVPLQRLQQPVPRRGHVGAASATVAVPNNPAAPKALAAANLSARFLEMVPSSSPLARSSKNCSPIVPFPS